MHHQNDSPIRRQLRRPIIRHRKNDVRRPIPPARHQVRQPGFATNGSSRHHRLRSIRPADRYTRQVPITRPSLRIVKPRIVQTLSIRVRASTRIKRHRLPHLCIHRNRRRSRLSIHTHQGVMIRPFEIRNRPTHPRRKVILIRLTPSPDRSLIRRIHPAIRALHRILRSHPRTYPRPASRSHASPHKAA